LVLSTIQLVEIMLYMAT